MKPEKTKKAARAITFGVVLSLGVLCSSVMAQQPTAAPNTPKVQTNLKTQNATEQDLLPLLEGEVVVLGDVPVGKLLQKTLLSRLQAGRISMRILTSSDNVAFYAPVIKAGGQLRSLAGMKIAGGGLLVVGKNMIFLQPDPKTDPKTAQNQLTPSPLKFDPARPYQVVSGDIATSMRSRFEQMWTFAR
jgi:hypothetical protein